MATNIGTLMATVGVDTRPLKKGLRDAEKQTKASTGKMLSHWKAMATGIVATFALYKTAALVKETALLAARFETLDIVMRTVGKNAGYTAEEMHEFDIALRKTGISMIESRNSLARMAMAQLDLTKATQLGRIAQDAAVIGNINSSEAFQRMIYGIQTGNLIVLRRIGINVSFEKSYKDIAKATNRTVESFSEAEKAMIRLNTVVDYGPRVMGVYTAAMTTAGKKLTSFVRYVDDFKVKMGKAFGPATVMLVDAATTAMKEFQDEISKPEAQEALRNLSSQLAITIIQLGQDLPKAIKSTTNAIADMQAIYNSLPEGIIGAAGAGLIGRILFGGWGPAKIIAALYFMNTQMGQLGYGLKDIAKGYEEAADNFQKAWETIIGKRVKGLEFFTITDENRIINQFERMEKLLAERKSRLDIALEDPAKFYGDRGAALAEYEMMIALGVKIDEQQLKREMQLADDQINALIDQREQYNIEQLELEQELADDRWDIIIEAYHKRRELIELEKKFDQEYADMNKSRFDLERDQIEAQMEIYRKAGFDKIQIAELTSNKLIAIAQAEQQAKLAIYQNIAGGIANTFRQIAQAGGKQSKEAFALYKAFAIVQATIAAHASIVGALGSPPYGIPAMILAGVIAAQAFVQVAMIASAQPPSYDRGGISNAESIYQTGPIREAHIPIPSGGKIPVRFENKEKEPIQEQSRTPINIINVNDPGQLDMYLASARGQDAILNVLGARNQSVRRILR